MPPPSPSPSPHDVEDEEEAVLEFLSTFPAVRRGCRESDRDGDPNDNDDDDDDEDDEDAAVAAAALDVAGSPRCLRSFESDLSDGVALCDALGEIDPDDFGASSSASVARRSGDNWALKAGNWRRLLRGLRAYYSGGRGRVAALEGLASDPSAAAGLARRERPADLWLVVELVVAAAVTCPNKSEYVGRLLSLPPHTQAALKAVVQRGLARPEAGDGTDDAGVDASADRDLTDDRSDDDDDGDEENELVFGGAGRDPSSADPAGDSSFLFPDHRPDASAAAAAAAAAEEELALLKSQHALEKEDWTKASERLQSVVDDLQDRLVRRQEELIAVEEELSRTQSHLEDVQSQLAKALQDKSQLADDLDIAQAKAAQLVRAEATVAAYRKKLESQGSSSAATKDLEEQAAQYVRQIVELEAQVRKAASLPRAVADLEEKVARLERERDSLQETNRIRSEQLEQLQSQLDEAERSRKLHADEAAELRAQAEVESSLSPRSAAPPVSSSDVDDMRRRLQRLEAENRELRELSVARAVAAGDADSANSAALRDEIQRLQADLAAKTQENAKISSDKDKLEAYTKRTLAKFQDKYLVALQECKTKLKEKQDKIEALESRSASERTAQKREERLLSSTIYELGLAIMQNRLKER